MAISIKNKTTQTATSTNSVSFSHTSEGNNRLLVLLIHGYSSSGSVTTISSVTYEGTALSTVRSQAVTPIGEEIRGAFYQMVSPPLGSYTVSVTFTNTMSSIVVTAYTLNDVDQSSPDGDQDSNASASATSSTTPTLTISSNSLVLDLITINAGKTFTPGGSQVEQFDENPDAGASCAGSSLSIASDTTMSQTWDGTSVALLHQAVAFNEAVYSPPAISPRLIAY